MGQSRVMLRLMRLEQYLYERKESQTAFAKRSGIPQTIVNRVARGLDTLGKRWAQITVSTGGNVKPEDHYPPKRVAA